MLTTSANEFKEEIRAIAQTVENGVITEPSVDQARPAVIAMIWYNLSSGGEMKYTMILNEIKRKGVNGYGGFTGDEGEFANIELIETFFSGHVT